MDMVGEALCTDFDLIESVSLTALFSARFPYLSSLLSLYLYSLNCNIDYVTSAIKISMSSWFFLAPES